MKAKETVLQHQEEQFRRENYELSQHLGPSLSLCSLTPPLSFSLSLCGVE